VFICVVLSEIACEGPNKLLKNMPFLLYLHFKHILYTFYLFIWDEVNVPIWQLSGLCHCAFYWIETENWQFLLCYIQL